MSAWIPHCVLNRVQSFVFGNVLVVEVVDFARDPSNMASRPTGRRHVPMCTAVFSIPSAAGWWAWKFH